MNQRDIFFNKLYDFASRDKDIILLCADMGAPALDQWREKLPDQIINVGIAEQNMIAVAVGLVLGGKKVYCYAIAPFVTLRCYEFIKCDICLMNLPITLVGVGAGLSYNESGPTHHTTEDIAIMRALPNMNIVNCCDEGDAHYAAILSTTLNKPLYVRLDRHEKPNPPKIVFVSDEGVVEHYPFWIKPFVFPYVFLKNTKLIITVEEHVLNGGLGSIMAEYLADNNVNIPLKRIGINDEYFYKYGDRKDIWDGETELRNVLAEFKKSNKQEACSNTAPGP